MRYQPPKGLPPPQLEGRRTGRPKGSRNNAKFWADVLWGYEHRYEGEATPPNDVARLWWWFAFRHPDEVEEFLESYGRL